MMLLELKEELEKMKLTLQQLEPHLWGAAQGVAPSLG